MFKVSDGYYAALEESSGIYFSLVYDNKEEAEVLDRCRVLASSREESTTRRQMRCEARGLRGAVLLPGPKTEVVGQKTPKKEEEEAVVHGGTAETAAAGQRGTWRGSPEMTNLRRGITAPRYNTYYYVLISLIGLLLQTQYATGGMCWSSISNGRCKELLAQGVTKDNCCASNSAATTAYSEDDLNSGALFFWKVLGGGYQCIPCRESCAEVRCEEGKKCVVRKGRPRCVCNPECKAPRGGGPVCGTDGKSYKNLCRLKKRACKKGSHELAVAYNGHCQSSCARVRCGQGRSCLLDQNLSPHCVRCARRCPQPPPQERAAARPVCGADGNTYKSACHLRLAACRAGRAIPVAYKGHCKQNADCTTIRCREGQTCLSEMNSGRPRCVTCTFRCPRKRERIRNRTHRDRDPSATMLCATNNITYPSWCHIVKDACVTGYVLETRHAGPCNAYDASPLYIEKDNTSSNYGLDLADEDARFEDTESDSLSYNAQTHHSLALS
ncbi:PREDICTED: follistatin [Dufourea novaeangliae]|uniref:follistatin n=1 Tax=Dufourea novaeangliae TaxID=178035 RepID=UPI000767B911|nr:PREDICTED: follistatin [Dufourea novaeangliae]